MNTFIGIDPGKKGGIALINYSASDTIMICMEMPINAAGEIDACGAL